MSGFDWDGWEADLIDATVLETPTEQREREVEREKLLTDLATAPGFRTERERLYTIAWVRVLYAHPSVPLGYGPKARAYNIKAARAEELQDLVEDMVAGYVIEENEAQRKEGRGT